VTRWLIAVLLLASWPAAAQVTFEAEETAPAPKPAPEPAWSSPQLDFRLVTRLSVDLAFEGGGENVASLYRFATASFRTERGPLRLKISARLRWVTTEERPSSGSFWLLNGDRRRSDFEPSLGETSVSLTRWGVDWSAGFLDIAWGQNPAFSPADVLTPVDLRDGPFATPDTRLPVPAVRAKGAFGPIRWDAVWIPVFMPSKIPLYGNDWSPFVAVRSPALPDLSRYLDPTTFAAIEANPTATALPQADLTQPQGGVRLSTRLGNVDLAASWAEFVDRQPQLKLSNAFRQFVQAFQSTDQFAMLTSANTLIASIATEPPVTATYLHTRVFAVDAALSMGRLRWTLDAGYSPRRVFPLADLTSTVLPMASGALGVEWEGPPVVAMGVYSLAALQVPAEQRLLYLETEVTPASSTRDVFMTLAYLSASDSFFDDRLSVSVNGIVTQHGDFFLTPAARWRIHDAHTLALGANLIGGRSGSIGAAYHRNNEAYFEYVLKI
jgi:hypothetical protein